MATEDKNCIAAVEDTFDNLTSKEAYNYFLKAINGKLQVSVDPPVLVAFMSTILEWILINGIL